MIIDIILFGMFEIIDRDAGGRICKFKTMHGAIKTPNLLPVINPNKILISPKEMKKLFGTEIVITNSYIINKHKDLKEKALEKGIHKLIDFDGPIMTDSGTFQSYMYGNIDIDPIEIVRFQRDIGSDIGTILDIFGTPDQSKKESEHVIKETIKRAKMSVVEKGDMLLACTVQGSIYPDLRIKCAKELSGIDADFFPLGGVVPLMESQRYSDLINCIISSKKGLDPSKPVHLFGAGHPLIFPIAVALGCDFFDSSAYVKYANDDRMIFSWGTEKLHNLNELPCCCPVCTKLNAFELKKMDKSERILQLARHNLYVSFMELKRIRGAISNGGLWELVERRARSNPYLLESLKILRKKENKIWLGKFEPVSKNKAMFYTGNHTIHRPIVFRTNNRLISRYNFDFDTTVVFPDCNKPYFKFYSQDIKKILKKNNVNFVVRSKLGPVPIELDEMYPFAQSVVPNEVDNETTKESNKIFKRFLRGKKVLFFRKNLDILSSMEIKENENDLILKKICAVADMQFGKDASKALFIGDLKIVKSKKTGKIRNIFCDGNHILSMRAKDGLFTLKIHGARLLHDFFEYPIMRVVVKDDAVSFIREGKSVFSKFVEDCDPNLIPYDECLIVDNKDDLIAVGRCILNKNEMISFNYGVAVKNREINSLG